MRIAIFTDTFLPQINGVVRSIVTTANQLVERGHAVAVFTMDVSKLANGHAMSDLDARIPVHPFPSVALPGFPHIQARLPSLVGPLNGVRRFQADVIHLHTIFTM
ncbi:MAG: glycosyltransferase, partial [Gammaproteobacteria bacterium]